MHKSIIVVVYQYIAVDRSLAKVGVESSNLFARSNFRTFSSVFRHLAAGIVGLALSAGVARAEWREVTFPKADVTLRAVAVGGGGHVAVSGSKGTYGVSDDGGRTWRIVAIPDRQGLDFRGLAITGPGSAVLMSAGDAAAGGAGTGSRSDRAEPRSVGTWAAPGRRRTTKPSTPSPVLGRGAWRSAARVGSGSGKRLRPAVRPPRRV